MRIAYLVLFDRFPGLRLAGARVKENTVVHGLAELRVFTGSRAG